MRTFKKIALLLMATIPLVLSLPAYAVLAQGTTVEINNGNPVTLTVGQSMVASESGGIPITVKNLPALGVPLNGLAGFTFTIGWNPSVIRVDSAFQNTAAGWAAIVPGTVNNTAGTLTSTGFTTTYSTTDVILLYLGITVVGKVGDSATINITITSLGDKDGKPIAATSVAAPVLISAVALPPGQTGGNSPSPSVPPPPVTAPVTVISPGEPPPPSKPPRVQVTTPGTAAPTVAPNTPNTPPVATGVSPAPETPPRPPPAPAGTLNWLLLGSIGTGVVILGSVLYLLLRRQP